MVITHIIKPLNLNCVATLPCEIQMWEKTNNNTKETFWWRKETLQTNIAVNDPYDYKTRHTCRASESVCCTTKRR